MIFIVRQLSTVAATLARCSSGLPFSYTPNPTLTSAPNPNLDPDFKTWSSTIKLLHSIEILPWTNTLAYFDPMSVREKSFVT